HAEPARRSRLVAAAVLQRALEKLDLERAQRVAVAALRHRVRLADPPREPLRRDLALVGAEHRVEALQLVLELAHVAGEVVRRQGVERRGREDERAAPGLAGDALVQLLEQEREIVPARAQRRDLDAQPPGVRSKWAGGCCGRPT